MSTPQTIPTFHFPLHKDLPRSGNLKVTPAYVVLLWASQQKFTGLLNFERDHRIKRVLLDRGKITAMKSNLVPEGLEFILGRGFLSREEIQKLPAELSNGVDSTQQENQLIEFLRKQSRLSQRNVDRLLLIRREEHILNLFGWFDGNYNLEQKDETILTPSSPEIALSEIFASIEGFILKGNAGFETVQSIEPFVQQDELRKMGAATLMLYLGSRRGSGKLFLERGQRRKLFSYETGRIGAVSSTDVSETLGAILVRWNFLTADVVRKAEEQARIKGCRFREILLQDRLLTAERLSNALTALHTERILEAFGWRSGRYEFRGDLAAQALVTPRVQSLGDVPVGMVTPSFVLSDKLDELLTPQTNRTCLFTAVHSFQLATRIVQDIRLQFEAKGLRTRLLDSALHSPEELEAVSAQFDRVLWLTPEPRQVLEKHPSITKVVLIVKEKESKKSDVRKLLAELPKNITPYFVFSEMEPSKGKMKQLISRLRLRA